VPEVDVVACTLTVGFIPANSSNKIQFQILLPDEWNGRFLTVGNGGFYGGFNTGDLKSRVRQGYAVMSTDTGHAPSSNFLGYKWGPGEQNPPDMMYDWSYRAMKYSIPMAKEIVKDYYSKETVPSFYHSCSTGGRQGLRQLREDASLFDGMLIGAPAWNTVEFTSWVSYIQFLARSGPYLTAGDDSRAYQATVDQCDEVGQSANDEMVTAPLACKAVFEKNSSPWLTALGGNQKKLDLVKALIHPLPNPDGSNAVLYPGYDISAAGLLRTYITQDVFATSRSDRWFARFFLGLDADRNASKVWTDNGTDYVAAVRTWDNKYKASASAADAANFKGKMIMYAGLRDGTVPTPGTRLYVEAAARAMGDRLHYFEIPGMEHCAALNPSALPWYIGPSGLNLVNTSPTWVPKELDEYDALEVLAQWVAGKKDAMELKAVKFKEGTFKNGGTFEVAGEYRVTANEKPK
jgi:hypothetical protein